MPTYPANIRTIDAASFEEEFENVALTPGEMEGGYQISRPRFTRAPRRTWTFRYVEMGDADKTLLEDFWITVKGRSNSFQWTHPITAEVVTVRFGDMRMKFKRIGFGSLNIWESETVTLVEV